MNVDASAMQIAKNAAKAAIFEDESLAIPDEARNVRKAQYIPTFFTAQEQPQLHPIAAAATNRFQRNAQVMK